MRKRWVSLCRTFVTFMLWLRCLYIVPSLLLCLFYFFSVSCFWMNIKANLLPCVGMSSFLHLILTFVASKGSLLHSILTHFISQEGEITIFCGRNSNLIEMQKQCNFSLKRQKMTCFSHKSIKK